MNSAQMPDVVEPRGAGRRPSATDILRLLSSLPQPMPPQMANGGAVGGPMPPRALEIMPMLQGAFNADGGMLVDGPGDGRSDDVPASMDAFADTRLSRGEYVIPADVVSAMGDGSTDAGAEALNGLVEKTRAKWRKRTASFPSPGDR